MKRIFVGVIRLTIGFPSLWKGLWSILKSLWNDEPTDKEILDMADQMKVNIKAVPSPSMADPTHEIKFISHTYDPRKYKMAGDIRSAIVALT